MEENSAFGGNVRDYSMSFNIDNPRDILGRIHSAVSGVVGERIRSLRDDGRTVRWHISLQARFVKASDPEEVTSPNPTFFNQERYVLLPGHSVEDQLEVAEHNILKEIDNYEKVKFV